MNPGGLGDVPTTECWLSKDRIIARLCTKKSPTHKQIWTMHGIKSVPVHECSSRRIGCGGRASCASQCAQLMGNPSIERRASARNKGVVRVHGVAGGVSRNSKSLEVLRKKIDAHLAGEADCSKMDKVSGIGDFKLMSSTTSGSTSDTTSFCTWQEACLRDHLPVRDESSSQPMSKSCFARFPSKQRRTPHREPSIFGCLLEFRSQYYASIRRGQTCEGALPSHPPQPPNQSSLRKKMSLSVPQSDPGPKSSKFIRHHHSDSAKDFYRYRCHRCGRFDFSYGIDKDLRMCSQGGGLCAAVQVSLQDCRAFDGTQGNQSNSCVGTMMGHSSSTAGTAFKTTDAMR